MLWHRGLSFMCCFWMTVCVLFICSVDGFHGIFLAAGVVVMAKEGTLSACPSLLVQLLRRRVTHRYWTCPVKGIRTAARLLSSQVGHVRYLTSVMMGSKMEWNRASMYPETTTTKQRNGVAFRKTGGDTC
ncbi:hypothetical protein J3F83DRAFT_485489 [Trichoderma novae-zelandiae]